MITVITLTFNNYDELIKTCDSLNGVQGIEHLIINGGKCEKTLAFLRNYSGKSISEADKGISDAFNKGVLNSNTEYFCFLNSGDTLVDKNYFQWANQVIRDKQPEFIHAMVELAHPIYGNLILKPAYKIPLMPFCHQGMIMKKKTFINLGQFSNDFKIAMDFDLLVRADVNNLLKSNCFYPHVCIYMDGCGISSNQELRGLKERIQSISNANILTFKKLIYINNIKLLELKYYIKSLLHKIGAIYMLKRLVN